jgi:cytidylate kinase
MAFNYEIINQVKGQVKQALDYPSLVHYSSNKFDELRPLSYEELVKDRTRGRWADNPEKAKEYTESRRKFEKELHKRLASKGITTNPENSFLYATLAGHEQFGNPEQYKHEAALTPELINSSFFDVVGTSKSRTAFGEKGLRAALNKWRKAQELNNLKEEEYMGMPIRPRIEVITPLSVKPSLVSEPTKQAEVNPSDVILVSGHSGAGKTTAARKLSELLGIPLRSADDYPAFGEFFKKDPANRHLELIKGSPERKEFKGIARAAALDALSNLTGPAVVEGGQLSYMPSKFLSKYPNRVIVRTPLKQLLEQRLERVKNKQLAKGKPWNEEIAKKRNEAAKQIYNSNVSSMDRFANIPGTITHKSRDPVEKLIELMGKAG